MKKVMAVLLPLASLLVFVVTWNSVQERGEGVACSISTFFVLLDIVIINTLYLVYGLGLG